MRYAHVVRSPLARSAFRSGIPFMVCGLSDDEAIALVDDVFATGVAMEVDPVVHLLDDLGGTDRWTAVAHLRHGSCPYSVGIHQCDDLGDDDGYFS